MRIRKFRKCFLVVAQHISASQIQPALDFTRKTLLKIKDILKRYTLFGHTTECHSDLVMKSQHFGDMCFFPTDKVPL